MLNRISDTVIRSSSLDELKATGLTNSGRINAKEYGAKRLEEFPTFDSTASLNAAIIDANTKGVELRIPAGTYKTTSPLVFASANVRISGDGGTSTKIKPTGNFDAFVIGSNSGYSNSGYLKDIAIEGASARPTGFKAAVKIDGMRQFDISNVTIDNYDIGFDFINDCSGSMVTNPRTGEGVNVGVNLRTGLQSGNDIAFINPWLYGEVASVHIAGDCGGFRFFSGQYSGNKHSGTAPIDERGLFTIGKDYITGAIGMVGNISIQSDFEGFPYCWAIRVYDQANITLSSCEAKPFDAPAIGFLKMSNAKQSKVNLIKQDLKGQWSGTKLISLAGTFGDCSIHESNSFIDAFINGVYYSGSSALIQSQVTEGQAVFRSGGSSKMLIGRTLLKDNTDGFQMSTDWGATWTAVTGSNINPVVTSPNGSLWQLGMGDDGRPTYTQIS